MGESRVVLPESLKIPISNGDWILVRKRLTAGENKRMVKRGTYQAPTGRRWDSVEAGTAKMLAYLIDWSIAGPDGIPIPIRGELEAVIESAIDSIDPDTYGEILRAIEAHEVAMTAEREAEKNGTGGEKKSAAISPSPSAAGGALSGSVS